VAVVGGVVAIGAILLWNSRGLLEGYAGLFRVDDPAPSDAIVVLLGGPSCRPERAAALYREGLAPRVLICSDAGFSTGMPRETAFTVRRLVAMGVPADAITQVQRPVTSTKEEAAAILPVAVAAGMKRITVVTTSFHTARTLWIFRRLFRGTGIDIRTAAATDPMFNEADWYRSDEGLLTYLAETIKTVVYRVAY
jgi:uncharacterized SAM-binding protein YcdF (DUF218 family)